MQYCYLTANHLTDRRVSRSDLLNVNSPERTWNRGHTRHAAHTPSTGGARKTPDLPIAAHPGRPADIYDPPCLRGLGLHVTGQVPAAAYHLARYPLDAARGSPAALPHQPVGVRRGVGPGTRRGRQSGLRQPLRMLLRCHGRDRGRRAQALEIPGSGPHARYRRGPLLGPGTPAGPLLFRNDLRFHPRGRTPRRGPRPWPWVGSR